jgi:hypothetical protein
MATRGKGGYLGGSTLISPRDYKKWGSTALPKTGKLSKRRRVADNLDKTATALQQAAKMRFDALWVKEQTPYLTGTSPRTKASEEGYTQNICQH